MKITYNKKTDSAYIKFSDDEVTSRSSVSGLDFDYSNNEERLVGIEIMQASKKYPLKTFFTYELYPDWLEDLLAKEKK
jgi:uncharacterized protein YuzE